VDKVFVTLSSKLIGGEKAPTFFEGKGFSGVAQAIRLRKTNCYTIGKDIILEGHL
jgi:riboflavin biosynthesis pyrimidine reductase